MLKKYVEPKREEQGQHDFWRFDVDIQRRVYVQLWDRNNFDETVMLRRGLGEYKQTGLRRGDG